MSNSTAEDRAPAEVAGQAGHVTDSRPFRFYDNRQKYLGFVNTCNEKWTVAERTAQELSYLQPSNCSWSSCCVATQGQKAQGE